LDWRFYVGSGLAKWVMHCIKTECVVGLVNVKNVTMRVDGYWSRANLAYDPTHGFKIGISYNEFQIW